MSRGRRDTYSIWKFRHLAVKTEVLPKLEVKDQLIGISFLPYFVNIVKGFFSPAMRQNIGGLLIFLYYNSNLSEILLNYFKKIYFSVNFSSILVFI